MTKLYVNTWLAWHNRDEGATAAEYGLLVALIAVAIIVSITLLGGSLSNAFDSVSTELDTAVAPAPAPAP